LISTFAKLSTQEYTFAAKGGITMATAQMPNPKVDPVKADSRHYTVEFENDKIRVVRIKYGAKEKSVMHSHPESVSVFLNDCKAKFTYPDGKSENIEAKAGQVMHMDAFEHDPENLGGPFELIQIELKR
jgi:quercetin dioxygenase-like cupin family protein